VRGSGPLATDGTPPPSSLLPKTGDGTLVPEDEVLAKYPKLKGVNLPNLVVPLSPMTPKDRKDLDYGLSLGVDWVALSFVQHAHDMKRQLDNPAISTAFVFLEPFPVGLLVTLISAAILRKR